MPREQLLGAKQPQTPPTAGAPEASTDEHSTPSELCAATCLLEDGDDANSPFKSAPITVAEAAGHERTLSIAAVGEGQGAVGRATRMRGGVISSLMNKIFHIQRHEMAKFFTMSFMMFAIIYVFTMTRWAKIGRRADPCYVK